MRFRSYASLVVLDAVARHQSLTAAAAELNQSKGSVSYQISKLETELGFELLNRSRQRISLTERGERLWHISQAALGQIDEEITTLRSLDQSGIAIGALTYFIARWLSPRLENYFELHANTSLQLEPVTNFGDLARLQVSMAILWGNGNWDTEHELLFHAPSTPMASRRLANRVASEGLSKALNKIPLLLDSSGSSGWKQWYAKAGLSYPRGRGGLVWPDSSSRVQAVIDGQGIALCDRLVDADVETGRLVPVSDIQMDDYGYYLVYPHGPLQRPEAIAFRDWIIEQASHEG